MMCLQTKLVFTTAIVTFLLSIWSCKSVDVTPVYAEWTLGDGEHFTSYGASLTGKTLESDCDNNNKMFIIMGAIPDTTNGRMKIVDYNKATLAANELKIDITHGVGLDYLSTGSDNKLAKVYIVNGKLQVYFDSVRVRSYGSSGALNDSSTINGYWNQQ